MSDTPKIVVVMPHYGDIAPGAAEGFWGGYTYDCDPELRVQVTYRHRASNSLTPSAFNDCLANALVLRDRGEVTHLAMLHSDVEPVGPWLNILWAEMLRHSLDLVSAVVPIKNKLGRTSTAIGDRSDPWKVNRFIGVDDRERMAKTPTFTGADVCGPGEVLLVNTGLWLANLRKPWWDDRGDGQPFSFEIHNRIRRDGNRLHVEQRSEDWNMSRYLDRRGARYGATWCVGLCHAGQNRWPNFPEPETYANLLRHQALPESGDAQAA